jgi:RNA polymerase sigma-70 factor (ECF subfamily)
MGTGGRHRPARTDAELLAAADADATAFRELYDRHARRIHDFLVRRTGDRDAALELTAETFARGWLSRHRFEDRMDGTAAPWLFGIARNVLLRSVRDRRIEQAACERLGLREALDRAGSEAGAAGAAAAPSEIWLDGLDADLEAALASLPIGQRRAVSLRFLDDLSYDDVARELRCSPVAARIRVSRGLTAMRAAMKGTR